MRAIHFIPLLALSGIALQSCQKEDSDPTASTPNTAGAARSFKVRMTDSPADYSGLQVQLIRVDAYLDNHGWVNLSDDEQMISVLDLTNGAETTISYDSDAEDGHYSRIKLTFGTDNHLTLNSGLGSGSGIDLGFGAQSSAEVVVNIDEQVDATHSGDVLLDFNVAQSILVVGSTYFMNPFIDEVENEHTGISGDVQGSVQASVTLHNGQHSYNTYVSASGEFLIRGVEDGTYQLSIDGWVQGNAQLQHNDIDNVVITEGQIRSMGQIQL